MIRASYTTCTFEWAFKRKNNPQTSVVSSTNDAFVLVASKPPPASPQRHPTEVLHLTKTKKQAMSRHATGSTSSRLEKEFMANTVTICNHVSPYDLRHNQTRCHQHRALDTDHHWLNQTSTDAYERKCRSMTTHWRDRRVLRPTLAGLLSKKRP